MGIAMKNTPQKFAPEELYSLVAEAEDILSPLVDQAMLSPKPCPKCDSKMVCVVDPDNPFTSGKLIQNFILQCPACWTRSS